MQGRSISHGRCRQKRKPATISTPKSVASPTASTPARVPAASSAVAAAAEAARRAGGPRGRGSRRRGRLRARRLRLLRNSFKHLPWGCAGGGAFSPLPSRTTVLLKQGRSRTAYRHTPPTAALGHHSAWMPQDLAIKPSECVVARNGQPISECTRTSSNSSGGCAPPSRATGRALLPGAQTTKCGTPVTPACVSTAARPHGPRASSRGLGERDTGTEGCGARTPNAEGQRRGPSSEEGVTPTLKSAKSAARRPCAPPTWVAVQLLLCLLQVGLRVVQHLGAVGAACGRARVFRAARRRAAVNAQKQLARRQRAHRENIQYRRAPMRGAAPWRPRRPAGPRRRPPPAGTLGR